ncbi:protein GVQW3-like [Octopus bimaculoides]|uniref:protein GVQW3-like n=1 Tax=Octopus bimaculoides TaxID=37653 RepID=UPI00071CCC6C|nr:protein GVQW3-like [Octopus bimaculoides]|eukprot:XP_014785597.1 PREDICTED: putative uncharacterized protein FLJ37770 [Octopus bimaculoides]
MDRKLEQGTSVKFCVELWKSAAERLTMLREAYGDESMGRTQCFKWHGRFKTGRTSPVDDERSGRPAMRVTQENVEKSSQLVHENGRKTINKILKRLRKTFGESDRICGARAIEFLPTTMH